MTIPPIFSVSAVGVGLLSPSIFLAFLPGAENINAYIPEEQNKSISPTTPEKDYKSKRIESHSGGVYVTPNDSSTEYFLNKYDLGLDNFNLSFSASKQEYLDFDKTQIKISLFDKPAWNSEQKKDEYKDVESEKTQSLFSLGLDEVKVKQLLLSLSTRRDWTKWASETNYWAVYALIWPKSLNELKDLKIKYFKEFDSLKTYIETKVKSCTGNKKSCIANINELSIIEQDRLSFFLDSSK